MVQERLYPQKLTGFGFLSGKIPGHLEMTNSAALRPDCLAAKHASWGISCV